MRLQNILIIYANFHLHPLSFKQFNRQYQRIKTKEANKNKNKNLSLSKFKPVGIMHLFERRGINGKQI